MEHTSDRRDEHADELQAQPEVRRLPDPDIPLLLLEQNQGELVGGSGIGAGSESSSESWRAGQPRRLADGGVDVVGDELGVDRDRDRGSFAGGGDHLRARVGCVAGRPDAGHARAAVGVDPDESSREQLAAEGCREPVRVRAQRGSDEERVARDAATVGELDRSQAVVGDDEALDGPVDDRDPAGVERRALAGP